MVVHYSNPPTASGPREERDSLLTSGGLNIEAPADILREMGERHRAERLRNHNHHLYNLHAGHSMPPPVDSLHRETAASADAREQRLRKHKYDMFQEKMRIKKERDYAKYLEKKQKKNHEYKFQVGIHQQLSHTGSIGNITFKSESIAVHFYLLGLVI